MAARLGPEASRAVMRERRRELRAEHRKTLGQCPGSGRPPFSDESERHDGKGECEVCGDMFALRKDGTVRAHDERPELDPHWRSKELAKRAARYYRSVAKLAGAANENEYYEQD